MDEKGIVGPENGIMEKHIGLKGHSELSGAHVCHVLGKGTICHLELILS